MVERLAPLHTPPILFAHRGARAHAPENTLESFRLALRLGASGLESDVWLTADGVPVLDHDGLIGRFRRRPISEFRVGDLPAHIPTLDDLYTECGTGFDLSLDVKDGAAAEAVLDIARSRGAIDRLWLCHPDAELLETWRGRSEAVRLVHSTRLALLRADGVERHASRMRDRTIDAVNLHRSEWTGGLVAMFHRFNRLALGWDAQHERMILELLMKGIDGVFSDHVDRLVDAARQVGDLD